MYAKQIKCCIVRISYPGDIQWSDCLTKLARVLPSLSTHEQPSKDSAPLVASACNYRSDEERGRSYLSPSQVTVGTEY